MAFWMNWVTTSDFTWLCLVIFHHLQVIFHYLSGCLPSTLKYWATELLTFWLNWVTTPDFTWPHPVYYCSSSIVFWSSSTIFQVVSPYQGSIELLCHSSSSVTAPLPWYHGTLTLKLSFRSSFIIFNVIFQIIFHRSHQDSFNCVYLPSIISILLLYIKYSGFGAGDQRSAAPHFLSF